MHGLGNDFVVVDARGKSNPITAELARKIGDRHFGVGFDQLAVILVSKHIIVVIEDIFFIIEDIFLIIENVFVIV